MSARSTGGCFGTQGGGCALVILSISSAKKISKLLIKYSKNDYLQVAMWKSENGLKSGEKVPLLRGHPVRVRHAAGTLGSGRGGGSSEAAGCDALRAGLC